MKTVDTTRSTAKAEARDMPHGVVHGLAAVAFSSLPLFFAGAFGSQVPGPVADAMGKSAIASAAMLLCSLVGYGVTVPIRLLAAFQHLAAGLLVSSVAVELVPPIMEAPNDLRSNLAIIGGFIGGTVAFFALGAYCGHEHGDHDGEHDHDHHDDHGHHHRHDLDLTRHHEHSEPALSMREEIVEVAPAPVPAAPAAPAAAAPAAGGTPRTPRTPRGLTKLEHVKRARAVDSPPYPGALVAAVVVDSAVDGMLIGLASASATEVATAGVVLAIALAIEMGFTGLAYAAALRKQPTIIGIVSVVAPPFVLLGASVFGAGAAELVVGYPTAHVALLSFGATALLYLVVVELLREAHEGMGDEDDNLTRVIEAMFFVGFFSAVLLERALDS